MPAAYFILRNNLNCDKFFVNFIMELSFNKLKRKDIICVTDGKNLGKICDAVILYPENMLGGYFVTGSKGFKLTKQELFVPVANIVKIGEDVILVNLEEEDRVPKPCGKKQKGNCPPKNCCPPPQNCQPQNSANTCPPPSNGAGRISYDEYE